MGVQMQNRRAVRKVPTAAVAARFLVDGYVVAHGEVSDISLGGAGLLSAEDFKAGDSLDLHLETEERPHLSLQSKVEIVWCQRTGGDQRRARCGVRWALGPGIGRGLLNDFITATCAEH